MIRKHDNKKGILLLSSGEFFDPQMQVNISHERLDSKNLLNFDVKKYSVHIAS